MKKIILYFKYGLEFLGSWLTIYFFRSLGQKRASAFGGKFARWVGPLLPVHRVAQRNVMQVFPHLSVEEREQLLARMWQHWGSVCAEYCHLNALGRCKLEIKGSHIDRFKDKACIFVSGHFGNFQLIALALKQRGFKVTQVYRQANNPWVDTIMQRFQRQVCHRVVSKQDYSIKAIADALHAGESVLILIDQKFASGPLIPFLGHGAHTTTVPARFSQKYGFPLVPICNTRLENGTFQVECFSPIAVQDSAQDMMRDVHTHLEQWIQDNPEQWFWIHKRWPFDYRRGTVV